MPTRLKERLKRRWENTIVESYLASICQPFLSNFGLQIFRQGVAPFSPHVSQELCKRQPSQTSRFNFWVLGFVRRPCQRSSLNFQLDLRLLGLWNFQLDLRLRQHCGLGSTMWMHWLQALHVLSDHTLSSMRVFDLAISTSNRSSSKRFLFLKPMFVVA